MWVGKDRKILTVLLCGILAAGVTPAIAQEDQSQEEAIQAAIEQAFEAEVIVTGSLIPRQDLEALSPVTVLDPEEITYSGTTRIEDLITSLPQAFQAQNSTIANGASGTATVALRHLGSIRTLVLINGRRLGPGDPYSTAPDLNFVPSALVKRVDVLTGGASSVYGADAVAGVVNFVLDTDFEGVRGGIQYSFYQHNNNNEIAQSINESVGFDYPSGNITDGDGINANVAIGGKFADGRGHGSAYVDFRDFDAVTKSERDYFNCSVSRGSDGPRCGGSSTTPHGRFILFGSPENDFAFLADYALDITGPGDQFRPRTGDDVFNYGPYNHIQRPDTKYSAGGFVNYRINEHFEAYAEVMFMDDFTDAQIAPTGTFGNTDTVNCNNPMFSDQQRELLCVPDAVFTNANGVEVVNISILKRNVEGGPRINKLWHTSYRVLAGLRGDINETWSYDLYGLRAFVSSPRIYINDFHIERMNDALNVVENADTGEWECLSGNADCVPYNLFQWGGVTQEAIDYMSENAIAVTSTKTEMLNGTITGDLEDYGIAFPSASEGIQVALGAEYRIESLFIQADHARETGNISGFGAATVPIDDGFNVKELFFEALVPIVQDTTGFQDLTLELGYRHSDYNLSGGQATYKAQLSWAPSNSLKFRAGFNRAARAPNAQELFLPQTTGLGGAEDICANDQATGVPSATLEQCLRTGMTEAQYGNVLPNPANQYNTLTGGNPLLTPEVADTLTVGFVWTPQSIPGLSATIDYYDIQIEDTIGALGADDIIQQCANTGDANLCSLIHRDNAGTLWLTQDGYTETTQQNIGFLGAEGVDLNANYLMSLGNAGFLNMSLIGTYLLESSYADPLIAYDCVGYYGNQCGQPDSKWRHRARFSWETNFKTVFSLGWRYIGSALIDDASPDEDLANEDLLDSWRANDAYEMKAYNYFDLSATVSFAKHYQFTFGINNILDEDPPLAPSLSDTGFGGTYDPLGRFIHTSLRFNF
ncbi:MAG: TonB-dependent receptor [bacterium]|nr:TonB-dependent receptor [bacterium]